MLVDSPLLYYVVIPTILFVSALFFLRPRKGGENAPPMIKSNVNIPIFGPCIEFGKSPMKMVKRLYDDYGPVYTVPILNQRLTFLVGPDAQAPFFKCLDDQLSPQEVYGFMKPVFGAGVVYDASKKNRQTQFQSMASGLRVSRLKGYVAKIEKETREFLKTWGDSGTVDLLHELSDLTILTASRCLHGNDVRETMYKEVSALYHDLDQGVTPLSVFFPNAPTRAHAKRNKARLAMVDLFSKVIAARRTDPNSGSDGTDILSIFMDIKYKDGTPITDEQITGLLIALLFAGQHTSCITSTWTSMFIARDPAIVKKLIEEQNKLFSADPTAPVDYDKLQEMEYLHNCMREALRLSPPLILLMRKALKNITVTVPVKPQNDNQNATTKTYVIPEGDTVLVSPSVGMRLEEVFANPEQFDPDRYVPPREEHKIPYAYLGFGGGMHSCMGQNFAFLQVKTILSIMFREYEFEMVGKEFPECDFEAMVVGPKGDCSVRYKKRQA